MERRYTMGKDEQMKELYGLSQDPGRKEFLDKLFPYLNRVRVNFNRLPIMAKQSLDLYEFYRLVTDRGGLLEVIRRKLWQEIIRGLNLPNTITSAAFTLRTQYKKFLYEYECYERGFSTLEELDALIDSNKRESKNSVPQQPQQPPPINHTNHLINRAMNNHNLNLNMNRGSFSSFTNIHFGNNLSNLQMERTSNIGGVSSLTSNNLEEAGFNSLGVLTPNSQQPENVRQSSSSESSDSDTNVEPSDNRSFEDYLASITNHLRGQHQDSAESGLGSSSSGETSPIPTHPQTNEQMEVQATTPSDDGIVDLSAPLDLAPPQKKQQPKQKHRHPIASTSSHALAMHLLSHNPKKRHIPASISHLQKVAPTGADPRSGLSLALQSQQQRCQDQSAPLALVSKNKQKKELQRMPTQPLGDPRSVLEAAAYKLMPLALSHKKKSRRAVDLRAPSNLGGEPLSLQHKQKVSVVTQGPKINVRTDLLSVSSSDVKPAQEVQQRKLANPEPQPPRIPAEPTFAPSAQVNPQPVNENSSMALALLSQNNSPVEMQSMAALLGQQGPSSSTHVNSELQDMPESNQLSKLLQSHQQRDILHFLSSCGQTPNLQVNPAMQTIIAGQMGCDRNQAANLALLLQNIPQMERAVVYPELQNVIVHYLKLFQQKGMYIPPAQGHNSEIVKLAMLAYCEQHQANNPPGQQQVAVAAAPPTPPPPPPVDASLSKRRRVDVVQEIQAPPPMVNMPIGTYVSSSAFCPPPNFKRNNIEDDEDDGRIRIEDLDARTKRVREEVPTGNMAPPPVAAQPTVKIQPVTVRASSKRKSPTVIEALKLLHLKQALKNGGISFEIKKSDKGGLSLGVGLNGIKWKGCLKLKNMRYDAAIIKEVENLSPPVRPLIKVPSLEDLSMPPQPSGSGVNIPNLLAMLQMQQNNTYSRTWG